MSPKIAVLLGGTSAERDVSLVTGMAIAKALDEKNFEVTAMDCAYSPQPIDFHHFNSHRAIQINPSEIEKEKTELNRNLLKIIEYLVQQKFDLAFIGLHGGYGENGQLQALLEIAGIPFTGSGHLASGLGMDKNLSKILFRDAGVSTAPWLFLTKKSVSFQTIEKKVGLPLVIKPNDQGSTVGLTVVTNLAHLPQAINKAFQFSETVIAEKFIPGTELTVPILGNDPLPIIEIIPKKGIYDYENKYQAGKTHYVVPAELPAALTTEIQHLALKAFRALGCKHYGRVDFRLTPDLEPYCLEVNTLPGMTPTSLVPKSALAVGIEFPDLVERIVKLSLEDASVKM